MQETSPEGMMAADIHVHQGGRYLIASNRGPKDTLAIVRINPESGDIKLVRTVEPLCKWPRNFTLTEDGKHLLVAGQHSNNVLLFDVIESDLDLTLVPQPAFDLQVPAPVCLLLRPLHS